MQGVGFSRAYRFYSADDGPRVEGTVFRQPGSKGPWLAIVEGTEIRVLMGGRDIAASEAIRQARLQEVERSQASISTPEMGFGYR